MIRRAGCSFQGQFYVSSDSCKIAVSFCGKTAARIELLDHFQLTGPDLQERASVSFNDSFDVRNDRAVAVQPVFAAVQGYVGIETANLKGQRINFLRRDVRRIR